MKVEITEFDQLEKFAKGFTSQLKGGDVVGLVGDLGAGKTTFTQHVAHELGVQKEVKSPTFILVREYSTGKNAAARNIRKMIHADAYRLDNEDELWAIGFDDMADDPQSVVFVEWADRVPSLHDYSTYKELKFSFEEGEKRYIDYS